MHPYKRALAGLLIAGALVSQTPAMVHADDNKEPSTVSHCYMSRNINGVQSSSSDCQEVRSQVARDLDSLYSMLSRLFRPAQSEPDAATDEASAPEAQSESQSEPARMSEPEPDPILAHAIDSIAAFLQHLFFRLPLLWR
jgi:hypothetical protein